MIMLDDLDRAIIQLLMQDGRQSFRRLANKLNVSVPTVKSRYTRLVNLGVIKCNNRCLKVRGICNSTNIT